MVCNAIPKKVPHIERVVLLESAHARNYSPAWCGRSRSRTESVRGTGAGAGLRWWRIREVNSRWWQRLYSASVMNAREFNLQQLARGLPLRRTNQALQLLRLSGRYLVAETRAFLAVTRVLISLPQIQSVTRTVSCNRFLNQRCHVGSSHSLSSRWHLPRCSVREP